MPSLIIASNRLPIRLLGDGSLERTTGGLASALEGCELGDDFIWVGWPGACPHAEGSTTEDFKNNLRQLGVEPVLISTKNLAGYYDGYANSTLWPLLHYMTERARFEPEWIVSYRAVNAQFAEVIASQADLGAQVWVHDYHLMLLPKLLRELRPDLKIGFFLHTPFPSSDVFRALPERDELLDGLLGCDLIGFHTYNYLRHFISSLIHILGIEAEIDGLWHHDRHIQLGVYPIGHNAQGFQQASASDVFQQTHREHTEQLGSGKLILSVERLDYTKGVPQKLQAIRHFLHTHPGLRGKVHFVLIAVPSRNGVAEYDALTEKVQCEVGAINGDYGDVGHTPLQFLHRSFQLENLAALYALADVCMVTPTIDGMNLVAKEFIDCKRPSHMARPGVLILSEFAGAAQEMSHALQVNPHDTVGVAQALHTALTMGESDMWRRTHAMQNRLKLNDAKAWAKRYLTDLAKATPPKKGASNQSKINALQQDLLKQISHHQTIALFLDYDGTLSPFTLSPEDAVPSAELITILKALSSHPAIKLAVVSGRPKSFLEKHLGHLPLNLVAEHGFYWKLSNMEQWQQLNPHIDTSWKEHVLPQLEAAAALTPGSEIEEKHSSLVWHYRQSEPVFGLWRAKGLLAELTSTTASLPVSVHHGQKIVEVASQLVNKGVAVERMLQLWKPDAALVAGDDVTDESMFALTPPAGTQFHTLKIGDGDTRAHQRSSIDGLRNLLQSLAESSPDNNKPH